MEEILKIKEEAKSRLGSAEDLKALESIRREYLGKKGFITLILRSLGKLPAEGRPGAGKCANQVKREIEALLSTRKKELEERKKIVEEAIDVTLPGHSLKLGTKHPLTQVLDEIKKIFMNLGFEIVEGPEVELEYYNFIALNIPPYHPVRDEHDSFYITDEVLLRTETSAVQIRTMEKRKPPVKIIAPGRVYRRDAVDRTHSHTFHQVEGLWVDKNITFGDLKGTLALFAQQMFGEKVSMRFRPDYFPFTEPSADGAISCIICEGRGCPVCSNTGWLEIFGCGMVHPKVLSNVGYDPEKIGGYAFGLGVERIAMLKYGIDDMRLFFENDLRFLEQF